MTKEGLKHAARRGLILEILKGEFPQGVDFVVLRYALSNLGHDLTERDLSSYLIYLENSSYITITRDVSKNILFAVINNAGLNLIDGFTEDKTILFR